jgi:hypothetical protein
VNDFKPEVRFKGVKIAVAMQERVTGGDAKSCDEAVHQLSDG